MSRKTWQEVRATRLAPPAARSAYWRAQRAFQIGEEVRRLRIAAGLSQRQLADKMGSSQFVIARLEAGGVEPTLATLDRVASALGADLDIHFAAIA